MTKKNAKIDVESIRELARTEILAERTKAAVEKLKELYRAREKAVLIVQNIDRDIDTYLSHIEDNATYASAGVKL